MALRNESTQAVVLRRRDLKEADRIVALYTRRFGKLSAVAKGVRRSSSKMGSSLEPLSIAEVSLYRKPGASLATLTQAQTIHSDKIKTLREDISRFAAAQVLAEMVDLLTPEEHPDENLYQHLHFFAVKLTKTRGVETMLRTAQIKLLAALGYAPEVFRSILSDEEIPEEACFFSASRGGVLKPSERALLKDARPISRGARSFLAASLTIPCEKTGAFRLTPATALEIRRLLADYLEFHVNVRLKSEEFFETVSGESEGLTKDPKSL